MRVGVLTGGGDCPGLNAVIRAVVRRGVKEFGYEFVGFRDGWKGPARGRHHRARHPAGARHPAARRHHPRLLAHQPVQDRGRRREDQGQPGASSASTRWSPSAARTRSGVATRLSDLGVNVVGVPKTIDNDLNATDFTFGFDTAVNIAMEAIDRLHTTAESHHRVLVVEVMGRHAGWIALHAGIAGGANVVLIPEQPFDIEQVCALRRGALQEPVLADHRGLRGGHAGRGRRHEPGLRREGRVRPRAARRHRRPAGQGDRGPHRQGVARGGARPRPARRHADRLRPLAGDPLRAARDRGGRPRATSAR